MLFMLVGERGGVSLVCLDPTLLGACPKMQTFAMLFWEPSHIPGAICPKLMLLLLFLSASFYPDVHRGYIHWGEREILGFLEAILCYLSLIKLLHMQ